MVVIAILPVLLVEAHVDIIVAGSKVEALDPDPKGNAVGSHGKLDGSGFGRRVQAGTTVLQADLDLRLHAL
jgi:hypothetical protein